MSGRYLSHTGDFHRTVFKSCLRCIRRAQLDHSRLVCAVSRKTMCVVSKTGHDNTCHMSMYVSVRSESCNRHCVPGLWESSRSVVLCSDVEDVSDKVGAT